MSKQIDSRGLQGKFQLQTASYVSFCPMSIKLNARHSGVVEIIELFQSSSVQFSSVTQSCLTLCDPMDCSTQGFPVHHQLPELTQIHVHRISDGNYKSNFQSNCKSNPSYKHGSYISYIFSDNLCKQACCLTSYVPSICIVHLKPETFLPGSA